MSYTKQNFQDGGVLKAEHLNAMDDQIALNAEHNHDGIYIKQTELDGAVNTALQTAKDSGDFDGAGIESVSQTVTTTASGGENVITVTLTNGNKSTFKVNNGYNGKTAFQYAQGAGYDGSETEFASRLANDEIYFGDDEVMPDTCNLQIFSDGNEETEAFGEYALADHNHDGTYVKQTELDSAVNTALQIAKASGEFDGDDGYTPVKGVDYVDGYTPVKGVDYDDGKDGTIQLTPLFAESLEWLKENGEEGKVYVLPDKFIYAYFEAKSTVSYTNLLPTADTDTLFDGDVTTATKYTGYFGDVRLNSSGKLETQAGSYVTGFIPYEYDGDGDANDKIRVKNMAWCTSANTMGIWAYDSNHAFLGILVGLGRGKATSFEEAIDDTGNGTAGRLYTKERDGQYMMTYTPSESSNVTNGTIDTSKIAYIRIFMGDFANAIITINQEITSGGSEGGIGWNNTGHAFVPANYESRILDLEKRMSSIVPNGSNIDLNYIRNWDMPIYDANIPVFETTATKAAISESERNCASLYAKYDALMAQYPEYITKTDHGVCSDGVTHMYQYDIKAPKTISTGSLFSEVKPKAILMSGIHREYACAYGLYYAIEEIVSNPELRQFLNNVHLIVFPCANPYAFDYDNGTHYQNANGVEIHRNFEVGFVNYEAEGDDQYSGSGPLSEIESQVIDKVMRANKDAAFVLSAHTYNNLKDGATDHRVMWCSAGTLYTCNLACRLIQKMSVSFRKRFGDQFTGDVISEPMGYVSVSGTGGSEYRQATKYGIQGFNFEVSETFSPTDTDKRTSFAMTRYAEVYANMLITAFGVYDYKDKDKYCKYI